MLSLFSLPVFPEKYWKITNLATRSPRLRLPVVRTEFVLENGAKYCLFPRERLLGSNLPVNRGRWNFDTIRYDYYLMIMSPLKRLKPVPLICVWKTRQKLGHALYR